MLSPILHVATTGPVLHAMYDGQRRLATNNSTGKVYCMHRVCKRDQAELKAFNREVEIMRLFAGHPNIVQMVEVHEDADSLMLITELCEGNLIDRFIKQGFYTEAQAAEAAKILLETVAYCHSLGVVIRDIKPENLLLARSSNKIANIKIGNVGNAAILPGSSSALKMGASEGSDYVTPFYPAPEILTSNLCGKHSDVWSLGMVLYMALSGQRPFLEVPADEIHEAILSKDLDFSSPVWDKISTDAVDFITRATLKDHLKRATIPELLSHRWLETGLRTGSDQAETRKLLATSDRGAIETSVSGPVASPKTKTEFRPSQSQI